MGPKPVPISRRPVLNPTGGWAASFRKKRGPSHGVYTPFSATRHFRTLWARDNGRLIAQGRALLSSGIVHFNEA